MVESEFQSIVEQEAIDLLVDLCGPGSSQSGTNCRVVEDHLKQFARAIAPKPPAVSSESAGVEEPIHATRITDVPGPGNAADRASAERVCRNLGMTDDASFNLAFTAIVGARADDLRRQPTTEQPGGVTQEDRESWIKLDDLDGSFAEACRAGRYDSIAGLQILYRHRRAGVAAGMERAAKLLEARAVEIEQTSTNASVGAMMRAIYREEAAAIRKESGNVR